MEDGAQMPLRFELRTDSAQRFHGADHEKAVALHALSDAVEQRGAVPIVEVDRDVAAEYNVELSQRGKVFHQVQLPETYHASNLVAKLPATGTGLK